MSAAAVGREEVHYLVHLLSAAALIWFALYSLHARHPTELLWAVSARRNASSASAEAVLSLTQRVRACHPEACICNATVALLQPPSGAVSQSTAAPRSDPAVWQQADVNASVLQQPPSAQQSLEQPRVVMFYHIAAMNNWREARTPPGLSTPVSLAVRLQLMTAHGAPLSEPRAQSGIAAVSPCPAAVIELWDHVDTEATRVRVNPAWTPSAFRA